MTAAMKRLLPIVLLLFACGPESPTPVAPEAPAPSARPVVTSSAASANDRAAKAKETFLSELAAANAHDASRVRQHYAIDAVKGTAGPDGWREVKGVDAIEKQTAAMLTSAPDIQWKPVRIFQREDLIVDEYVVVGTHAANGKRAGLRGVALYWFDDAGKIKKEHVYIDQLTMLIHTGRAEGKAPEPAAMPTANPQWVVSKNDATEEANIATFKATWPAKALLAKGFEHDDVASGAREKAAPSADFAPDQAWGFGDFVVAEMQMKGADGVAKHVVEVAEHDKGQLVRATLYSNRLEGKGVPPR
jgi:ketosteroid isomerase-like protein